MKWESCFAFEALRFEGELPSKLKTEVLMRERLHVITHATCFSSGKRECSWDLRMR